MFNFSCGVTAKPFVLRLHRIKKRWIGFNITEIWQLRRLKKAKAEIAVKFEISFN